MKRFTYIAVVFFVFAVASCTKEDIRPHSSCTEDEPTWRSVEGGVDGSVDDPVGGGFITDPDHDTDANGYAQGSEN